MTTNGASTPSDQRAAELKRAADSYAERDADDRLSWYWSPLNPGAAALRHQMENTLVRLLEQSGVPLEGRAVAEFGCGRGNKLAWLVSLGADEQRAFGIDLVADRVDSARTLLPRARFACGSADDTGVPAASFDVVAQFTLFSSVHDPEIRKRIAGEMDRVLVPGGVVLWFDARPPSAVLSALYALRGTAWWLLKGMWSGAKRSRASALVPFGRGDVVRLFPGYASRSRTACVSRDVIEARGPVTRRLTAAADLLPFLHTNLAVVLVKPHDAGEVPEA